MKNFYQSKPEAGIYDVSYGSLLHGEGTGHFRPVTISNSNLLLMGAVRDLLTLKCKNDDLLIVAKNNDSLQAIKY